MADTLPVGAAGITVWELGRPHEAAGLYNPGTTTVYLDDNPMQDPAADGTPLNPGANCIWTEDRALYVGVAVGTTGRIQVRGNADGIFDPAQISTQLIAQGLPALIAAQISIQGAPPIDQPGLLLSDVQVVASGVAPANTAVLDVTRYTMVEVWATETGIAAPNTNWRHLVLNWYSDLTGVDRIHGQHYYYGAFNGTQGIKVPVPGGAKGLQITSTAAVTVQQATLTYRVYAAMRATSPSSWNGNDNARVSGFVGLQSDGFAGIFNMSRVAAPIGTTTDYPRPYEGEALFSVNAPGVAGAATQALLYDLVDGTNFAKLVLPVSAGGISAMSKIIIPRRPIRCDVVQGGAGSWAVSLAMTPW